MKKTFRSALSALIASAALATQAQEMPEGYTCCNFHHDRDWISDANWRSLPMIPAGAKIKVLDYGWNNRANVEIDGRPMRIGHDYGRKEESLQQFLQKLVVKNDPQKKIAKYPE